LKKCANGPIYDATSPDYRDQHMRVNAWEGTGKELKVKRRFYVSSRDVRIVCPRFYTHSFTAATMVIRTCINAKLYVHCLSCDVQGQAEISDDSAKQL
jgi:hypothetical protein